MEYNNNNNNYYELNITMPSNRFHFHYANFQEFRWATGDPQTGWPGTFHIDYISVHEMFWFPFMKQHSLPCTLHICNPIISGVATWLIWAKESRDFKSWGSHWPFSLWTMASKRLNSHSKEDLSSLQKSEPWWTCIMSKKQISIVVNHQGF